MCGVCTDSVQDVNAPVNEAAGGGIKHGWNCQVQRRWFGLLQLPVVAFDIERTAVDDDALVVQLFGFIRDIFVPGCYQRADFGVVFAPIGHKILV